MLTIAQVKQAGREAGVSTSWNGAYKEWTIGGHYKTDCHQDALDTIRHQEKENKARYEQELAAFYASCGIKRK